MYIETQSLLWSSFTEDNKFIDKLEQIITYCVHNEIKKGLPKLPNVSADNGYDVNIIFTDDQRMRSLNKNWRNKDASTNVLSFAALEGISADALPQDEAIHLGDIILAFETIEKEARDASIDIKLHVFRLIIHGMYHILGYDHIQDYDYKQMFDCEQQALDYFSIHQYIDKL